MSSDNPVAPTPAHSCEALRVWGTTQTASPSVELRAGDLCCELQEGSVRRLAWQGTEVIRGISYLLRDTNWGTAASSVRNCTIERSEERFRARFEIHMVLPEGALAATAVVEGHASGRFIFEVSALAQSQLATNRCGFVVLHPAGAAGAPLQIEHTGGDIEDSSFPRCISPGQVAFDIRRLRHEPQPGLSVDCLMEAELPHDPCGKFEMEDQRNWSDASYKTYVASLLDPWPYLLEPGKQLTQRVTVAVADSRPSIHQTTPSKGHIAMLAMGAPIGQQLPPIGLGVPLGLERMRPDERAAVIALRPDWLVAEVDAADASGLLSQLTHLRVLAEETGSRTQLDVICPADWSPSDVASQVQTATQAAGIDPDAVRACPAPYLKSFQPSDNWPLLAPLEDYAAAFAKAFPAARVGGGMLTYFTELNRKRQSGESIRFVGHATCPLVHAADDVSVMQTHESLASIVDSVRAIWPDLGYRLGPITIGMHRNPYGERTADNPLRQRIAMAQDDPRHHAAYGAAWIAAYAAAVQGAGLELLSFHHSHGVGGPVLHPDMPDSRPGACIPAWRVQRVLTGAAGCDLHHLTGLAAQLTGLAWTGKTGDANILLANLTAKPVDVSLQGVWLATDLSRPCTASELDQPSIDGARNATTTDDHAVQTPLQLGPHQTLWLTS